MESPWQEGITRLQVDNVYLYVLILTSHCSSFVKVKVKTMKAKVFCCCNFSFWHFLFDLLVFWIVRYVFMTCWNLRLHFKYKHSHKVTFYWDFPFFDIFTCGGVGAAWHRMAFIPNPPIHSKKQQPEFFQA